jgi:hypothetical protein
MKRYGIQHKDARLDTEHPLVRVYVSRETMLGTECLHSHWEDNKRKFSDLKMWGRFIVLMPKTYSLKLALAVAGL